jgi:molybdopterin/thiamine biosynthesis adenylyltransferase
VTRKSSEGLGLTSAPLSYAKLAPTVERQMGRKFVKFQMEGTRGQVIAVDPEKVRCVRPYGPGNSPSTVIEFDNEHTIAVVGELTNVVSCLGFELVDFIDT